MKLRRIAYKTIQIGAVIYVAAYIYKKGQASHKKHSL